MTSRRSVLGFGAIALAALGWAVAAIVARRLFDSGVEPFELSAARSLVAAIGLSYFLRRPAVGAGSPRLRLIALGLSIALVNIVYYLAIERLSVAVALVLQYTAPALVVAWTAFMTRRPPSRDITMALVAALVGVILIVELVGGEVSALNGAGILFGFASAVLFASYSLLAEPVTRVYGAIGAMARAFAVAGVFWILFEIPRGWPAELVTAENLPDVLFVGIAGTLIPFVLYVWGIGQVRAERASIAATLEPMFAAAAAWVWLDQSLTPMQLLGGALVLAAVCMLQIRASIGERAAGPAEPALAERGA